MPFGIPGPSLPDPPDLPDLPGGGGGGGDDDGGGGGIDVPDIPVPEVPSPGEAGEGVGEAVTIPGRLLGAFLGGVGEGSGADDALASMKRKLIIGGVAVLGVLAYLVTRDGGE